MGDYAFCLVPSLVLYIGTREGAVSDQLAVSSEQDSVDWVVSIQTPFKNRTTTFKNVQLFLRVVSGA